MTAIFESPQRIRVSLIKPYRKEIVNLFKRSQRGDRGSQINYLKEKVEESSPLFSIRPGHDRWGWACDVVCPPAHPPAHRASVALHVLERAAVERCRRHAAALRALLGFDFASLFASPAEYKGLIA